MQNKSGQAVESMLNSDLPVNMAGKPCGKFMWSLENVLGRETFCHCQKARRNLAIPAKRGKISLATGPFCRETWNKWDVVVRLTLVHVLMVVVGKNLSSSVWSILLLWDRIHSLGQQLWYCLEQKEVFLEKKKCSIPQDFFGTPTLPLFYCFERQYGRLEVMWKSSIVGWYDSKTSNFGA